MYTSGVAVSGLVLSVLGVLPIVEPPPAAEPITVELISVNGSGCPAGSVKITVDPDNTAFQVSYDSFIARRGPGIRVADGRRNCQLAVEVHPIPGLTYAVRRADHYGRLHLAAGARAVQISNHYFAGPWAVARTSNSFTGPLDEAWHTSVDVEPESLAWVPCGMPRYLNINIELRVAPGTSDVATQTSVIELDPTATSSTYSLVWANCTAGG